MHIFSLTLEQKTFLLSQYMRHSEEVCFTTGDYDNKGCRIGRRMVPTYFPSEEEVQMGEMIFKIKDIVFLPEYLVCDEEEDNEDGDNRCDSQDSSDLNTAFYESDAEDREWSISSISKDNSFYLNESELEIELNA